MIISKMTNYNLLPNEGILLKSTNVLHGGFMSSYTDELILTNFHLIYVKRGMFGNVKEVQKIPLAQIKVVNNRVQVMWGQNPSSGTEQLQIYFIDGRQESFEFQENEKNEIVRWANEISKVVTGDSSNVLYENIQQQNGIKQRAVNVIKDALGVEDTVLPPKPVFHLSTMENNANNAREQDLKRVTRYCMGCGAPITGVKGQVVHCEYCDMDQEL